MPHRNTFTVKTLVEKSVQINTGAFSGELKLNLYNGFPDIEFKEHLLKSHLLGNGYCLYFTRHCIETVGGFDTKYNNKYEHIDVSRRIFNAGLTKHMFQDIVGSEQLIYCLDKNNAIQRSFTNREMQDNLKAGYEYFQSQANSSKYIEFRT